MASPGHRAQGLEQGLHGFAGRGGRQSGVVREESWDRYLHFVLGTHHLFMSYY